MVSVSVQFCKSFLNDFFDTNLEEQLKEAGNKLLDPPSSVDELLNLLDVMTLFPDMNISFLDSFCCMTVLEC
jgi:hypothetical protein